MHRGHSVRPIANRRHLKTLTRPVARENGSAILDSLGRGPKFSRAEEEISKV